MATTRRRALVFAASACIAAGLVAVLLAIRGHGERRSATSVGRTVPGVESRAELLAEATIDTRRTSLDVVSSSVGPERGETTQPMTDPVDAKPRAGIRVRVEDARGVPLAAFPIRMAGCADAPPVERTTGADGWVAFEGDELVMTSWNGDMVRVVLAAGAGGFGRHRAWIASGGADVFRIDGLAEAAIAVRGAREDATVGVAPDRWGIGPHGAYAGTEERLGERALVRLPVVANSGRLHAYVRRPGVMSTWSTSFLAPGVGDTVHVDVEVGRSPVELVGHVTDQRGEPLRSADIDVRLQEMSGEERDRMPTRARVPDARTDGEGRFAVELEPSWIGLSAVLHVRRQGETDLAGHVELAPIAEGRADVGVIVLTPVTAHEAGVVVDDLGAPVAGAELVLAPESEFSGEIGLEARSGEDGTFEIRGPRPLGRLVLHVESRAHFAERVTLGPEPRTDHRIVLRRGCTFSGRIEMADGTPADGVSIGVVYSEPKNFKIGHAVRTRADGAFSIQRLEPGAARVEVNEASTLLFSTMVELRPGENRDPRFDPLRLPASVVRIDLAFLGEDGREPKGLVLHVRARERDDRDVAFDAHVGRTGTERRSFLMGESALDLAVLAPGHRALVARSVRESRTYEMRRAPRVPLRFEPAPSVDHAPAELHWTVTSPGVRFAGWPVEVRGGRAEFDLVWRGEYGFRLMRRSGTGGIVACPATVTATLDPDAAPREIVLALPAVALAWLAASEEH